MEDMPEQLKPPENGHSVTSPPKKSGSTLYSEDDAGPSDPLVNTQATEAIQQAIAVAEASGRSESWTKARQVTEDLKPVPWFIWRLCNQILGREGHQSVLLDSSVMGLRRLLFAAASSSVFGRDTKVNSVRDALLTLKPDVVAAVAVVHATTRKLQSKPLDMLWRPLLDQALLRARLGFEIGKRNETFGGGRGFLSGFASSIGLPILMSAGTLEQATELMEAFSQDKAESADEIVYGTSSLQVGAMFLSSCGVSSEAANGFIEFANNHTTESAPTHIWASCAYLVQMIQQKKSHLAQKETLAEFNLDEASLQALLKLFKQLSREGHGIGWIE